MTYPEAPLDVLLEAAPGADLTADPATYLWLDITDDWYTPTPIRLKRGGEDEEAETSSSLEFDLRNSAPGRQGRYTPDSPESDLWPYFDLNCPLRLSLDAGTGMVRQTVQYLTGAYPTWPGNSGNLALVSVQAVGLLVRLQQGRDAMPAAYRTLRASAGCVGYWPMEAPGEADGPVTTLPSGLAAGSALAVASPGVTPGTDDGLPGTLRLTRWAASVPNSIYPYLSGMAAQGTVAAAAPGYWSVAMVVAGVMAEVPAPVLWRLLVVTMADGTTVELSGYAGWASGAFTVTRGVDVTALASTYFGDPTFNIFDGSVHTIEARQTQSGGDIITELYADGTLMHSTSAAGTLSYPASWVGPVTAIGSLDGNAVDNTGSAVIMGYLAFHSAPVTWYDAAARGYPGEEAHVRIGRLCAEEGVPYSVTATSSTPMGVQVTGAVVPLLRDCEQTDRGILDDSQGLVGYRALSELYNQDAVITVDGAGRQLFSPAPVGDDQKIRNDVTVSRPGGSAGVRVQDTAHIALRGRYSDGPTVNVATDAQLPHQAGWRVHEGTREGMRYPNLTLDMLRAPDLIPGWLVARPGDRAAITNPPPRQHAKGDVDLMLRGWQVAIYGRRAGWVAVCNCLPWDTYEVFEVESGSGNRSRIPAGVSTLDATYQPTDTALSVTSTTRLWIDSATYPAQFPVRCTIAGEVVDVTAIVGTGLTQAFTVTRGVTGFTKTLPSGSPVQLHRAPVLAL